jgi:outer membrane protein, multidrug efflux system
MKSERAEGRGRRTESGGRRTEGGGRRTEGRGRRTEGGGRRTGGAGWLVGVMLLSSVIGGCTTVGPNYKRPVVATPETFRGASTAVAGDAGSIADTKWATLFEDEPLRELIATALQQNFDVRIAAARILQAEAQLGITRSNQYPTVDAQASAQGQRSSLTSSDRDAVTAGVIQLGGSVSWELDFWGKYRRATEAARAQILGSEWGRRAVMSSLVSQIASGYFALRALDLELTIATRTLETRQESLRLTQVREQGGATSLVDVRQAEQLVFGATAQIIDVKRSIEQQENFMSALLGRNPGPIARGRALTDQPHAPELPAGLPSALLERRPDIRQAEQGIVAANAAIGIAKAAYFPQITLTGAGGLASTALSALFTGSAGAWSAAASVVQPVFTAGRTRSQVALADARRQEAELAYQQTIQQAFREVADALVGYRRSREFREAQEQLVRAAQDARRLADLRYQGGASSYLEVLDSDTRLFSAELDLVRAQLSELGAFVEIYRALGGGWNQG